MYCSVVELSILEDRCVEREKCGVENGLFFLHPELTVAPGDCVDFE